MASSTGKTKRQLLRDMATSMGLQTNTAHTSSIGQSQDKISGATLALVCATVRELHAARKGANKQTKEAYVRAETYLCYSTTTKTKYRYLPRQEREGLNRRAIALLKHPDVTADAKRRLQDTMQAVVEHITDFDERGRQETTLPMVEDPECIDASQTVIEAIMSKVFAGVVYAGLESDWPEEGRKLWEQARTSWVVGKIELRDRFELACFTKVLFPSAHLPKSFPIGTRFINAMTKQLQEDGLLTFTATHDRDRSNNTTMEQLEEDNDRESTRPREEEDIQAGTTNAQSIAESSGEDSAAPKDTQPKRRKSAAPGAPKRKRSRGDQNTALRPATNAPPQREGDILAGLGAYTKIYVDSASATQAFYQGRWKPADDDETLAEIDYDELVEEIYDAMCAMPDNANDFQLKMLRDVEKKIATLTSPKETLTQIAAMLAQALLNLYTKGTALRPDQLKGLRQTAADKTMSAEKRKDAILRILKATKRKLFHLLEGYEAILRFVAAPESEEAIILHNKAENDARRDKKKAAEREILELKSSKTANASNMPSAGGAQEQTDEDEDGDVIVVSSGAVG
ncbi:hypothetical protein KC332_g1324 [Hortaea werneckii]|nr:hypothetical protein KC358_g669 [Hortaea werneckii]KAI6852647.1 hypothetical protein KC350_g705 [Hortaea werneckii]KAI6943792.1 hypothetical protein KC341_g1270 [Hortaea werneckii]KAI6950439.1 hypothetical protein KC348_g700 [Hortaea werneckii]KAI6982587.1 hypothetical protein KC321_g561 [Hortaea werneckii]